MHCISRSGCYLVNSFCDVQEENCWTKESYWACWISVVIETRPQYRQTLTAKKSSGRESYEQQQVAHFIVERNMNQILKLSSSGRGTTEHKLPHSGKSRGPAKEEGPGFSKQQFIKNSPSRDTSPGVEPSKPIQTNFRAVNLMSSPRAASPLGQKRE